MVWRREVNVVPEIEASTVFWFFGLQRVGKIIESLSLDK